jgi:hypothetical protein
LRYSHIGDGVADNVNATGQIVDDDRRELDGDVNKTVWFQASPIERLQYASNYNIYWASRASTLRSWNVTESSSLDFRNRLSVAVDATEEYKLFEKEFRNRRAGLTVGYNTREYESVSVGYEFGRNFDADLQLWSVAARRKLSDAASLEYELQRVRLRGGGPLAHGAVEFHNRTRRNSWALMATMTVLADMKTAASAGGRRIPCAASTPAASGIAMML